MKLEKVAGGYLLWVNHQPSGGKEWVAKIVGKDPKYKFKREFLQVHERKWSRSGRTGSTAYMVQEGTLYEVNEPWGGRCYIVVKDGEIHELEISQVLEILAQEVKA